MADKSVEYYQQRLRKAEGDALFAANNGNADQQRVFLTKLEAAKLDLARAEAAAAGNPPSNSVSTSTSPVAQEAQAPANTAGNQTVQQSQPDAQPAQTPPPPPQNNRVEQSQAGQVNISSGPIYNDFGGGEVPISEMSDAERTEHIRANEALERSAYLDSLENGTEYVPGAATGNPAFGYTPPDPPPSAVEPDPPLPTGYGGGRGSVVEQPGERAAAAVPDAPAEDPVVNEYDEFSDIGRDVNAPPASTATPVDPVTDPVVNEYDEFGDIEERDLSSPPEPQEDAPTDDPVVNEYDEFGDIEERDLSAPPEAQEDAPTDDPVVNEYDEFSDIERDLQNPDGNTKSVAEPVESGPYDDEILRRQRAGEVATQEAEQQAAEEEADRIQQVNNAALDRLRKQSAVQQNRAPEGTGDWRVKLRLASGADYFYKSIVQAGDDVERNAGILQPLLATDGIVFPYTPSIQILYAADYNTYHPTHSNYQHYFYKGSKVGEVVLTATFTAQDTEEANYMLAVIHFLKSASKMFYGQDPQRGSPPPLLFLSGLGDYQFNEAPCVINQFNYVLPNEVDYIRANVAGIRAGETLQTNLRNKNNGTALNTWSSKINRILTTPGLTIGAENPTSRISGQTANLSSQDATYVPTKMEMTITLLPVQNRLQVSEQFSLKEYANGNLIKGGFW